ncbi:family 78 glycoside hydrolase catalytic domain [Akkermansiaceae bacterium]|nr:family 78 glycoside hydrolase catalytic domain [Akkermansiaceae bacterium]
MKILTVLSLLSSTIATMHAETKNPPLTQPLDLRSDGMTPPFCDSQKPVISKRGFIKRDEGHPLGGSAKPMLTWKIVSEERNVTASAWQVLVASSPALLEEGKADLWDSGKTPAGRAPGLEYGGKALAAGASCHWKVRWWGKGQEPSPWSEPAIWEVAPATPADWQGAQWIDDGRENPTEDADFYKPDPAPLMRREFEIPKPVTRARLHFAGLGLGMASINGQVLDNYAFNPPWTNFDKRILFSSHDVTDRIKEGKHCLGIRLGNGWYNPLPLRMWGHRNIRGSLPVGRPRAIALLVVDHPDGTSTTITTGDGWTTAQGPTIRNSIFIGEERDARLEPTGWDKPGFDDSKWSKAKVSGDSTLEPLQPLQMPPVRHKGGYPAQTITSPKPGVHIVDFGLNLTAVPGIRINAPAGTRITFRYGELLNEDGTLNPLTSIAGQIKGFKKGTQESKGGPGAPEFAWQQDVYIAKGGGEETFVPRFTFHAFRYMEISGLPTTPSTKDFSALPFHTDLPDAGSFSCSNEDLNRIQEICRRTFLNNVVTVQSDCPHRERFGYGGDIVATSETFMMNFDMSGFYSKTVRDWADAARPDGRLTDTAPFVGIDYCGVGWAMAHPLLLEQLHQHYGARALLDEQVPVAMKWLDGVAASRKEGLVTNGLGDHESLEQGKGPEFLTAMFIDAARRVARLARLIGKIDDATRYEAIAEESATAWSKAFLDKESGRVGVATQSAQTFALGYGAAGAADRKAVFGELVRNLTAPEDSPRLTTGIFGTQILLDELSKNGRSDLAYALADRDSFPSWKWMLKNGATTLWEDWEGGADVKSHNHPMFGSISAWFFNWLGGIECAEDAVAFDRILIRPQTVGGLYWVKSSHDTVRGKIVSNWHIKGETREFEITIPHGATASVELPALPGDVITEGGKPLSEHPEILQTRGDSTKHSLKLGGGRYRFNVAPGE